MTNEEQRKVEVLEILGIMRTEGGRNVVYRWLRRAGVDADSFHSDTHEHAKIAGRRQVGIEIRNEIQIACPGEYLQMLKEHIDGR